MTSLIDFCRAEIESLKAAKTWKKERVLEGPTGARVRVDGRNVLMLTSNNYLGFANHPRVLDAARNALSRWGNGLGSVRFICGTQQLHKDLERGDLEVLRDGGHDPLHVLLERERGPLRAPPRRGGRAPLGRPEPRLDHRRHPPLQGEALPRPARRPRGSREGARGGPGAPAPPLHHGRGLLDGGRDRAARARSRTSARSTTRRWSSTTRTRPASSARRGADRPRSSVS